MYQLTKIIATFAFIFSFASAELSLGNKVAVLKNKAMSNISIKEGPVDVTIEKIDGLPVLKEAYLKDSRSLDAKLAADNKWWHKFDETTLTVQVELSVKGTDGKVVKGNANVELKRHEDAEFFRKGSFVNILSALGSTWNPFQTKAEVREDPVTHKPKLYITFTQRINKLISATNENGDNPVEFSVDFVTLDANLKLPLSQLSLFGK